MILNDHQWIFIENFIWLRQTFRKLEEHFPFVVKTKYATDIEKLFRLEDISDQIDQLQTLDYIMDLTGHCSIHTLIDDNHNFRFKILKNFPFAGPPFLKSIHKFCILFFMPNHIYARFCAKGETYTTVSVARDHVSLKKYFYLRTSTSISIEQTQECVVLRQHIKNCGHDSFPLSHLIKKTRFPKQKIKFPFACKINPAIKNDLNKRKGEWRYFLVQKYRRGWLDLNLKNIQHSDFAR